MLCDPDAPEGLLHYKWGYVDGHLTRWTRGDLDEIYLELYPAKVMAELDELDEILAEARTFVTFLSETELLDEKSEPAEVLLDHLSRIEGRFRANMADRSPTASASACGAKPPPRECDLTTPERSRPSWRASTPGLGPNGTRSSARA